MITAAILDYQMCNIFSVKRACNSVGISTVITSDKKEISKADLIILPGVGAFAPAMEALNRLQLVPLIKELVAEGKPLVGICLGMQLLFSVSEEFENCQGLNLIPGRVRRFPSINASGNKLRVPHIGWNQLNRPGDSSWSKTALDNIGENPYVYFVHSYYVEPNDPKCILTTSNYGGHDFCSAVESKNILGFQFHPEKSGTTGVQVYNRVLEFSKRALKISA